MDRQEIIQLVVSLVARVMFLDESLVSEASHLDNLGLAENDLIYLVTAIQDEFDVDFSEEETNQLETVRDIVNKVAEKLG